MVNPTTNLELPAAGGVRDRVAAAGEAALLLLPAFAGRLTVPCGLTASVRGAAAWRTAGASRVDDVDHPMRGISIQVRHGWDDVEGEIDPEVAEGCASRPDDVGLFGFCFSSIWRLRVVAARTWCSAAPRGSRSRRRMFAVARWALGRLPRSAPLTGKPFPVELAPIGLHECRHTYVSLMHDRRLLAREDRRLRRPRAAPT